MRPQYLVMFLQFPNHCVFQMAKLACMQNYGGFMKYCLCYLSNFVYDPQA